MEHKLKTFLSSAQYQDEFIIEREGLPVVFSKEPLRSSFVLWRIEEQSSPQPVMDHYKTNVKDSDILIMLLGKTLRPGVEDEFKEAITNKIPIFAFIKESADREPAMNEFIRNVPQKEVSTSKYHTFQELSKMIEESLLQYYMRQPKHYQSPITPERIKMIQKDISAEERSLRLLVGVLGSDLADVTKDHILNVLITEAVKDSEFLKTEEEILNYVTSMVHVSKEEFRADIKRCLDILVANKNIEANHSGKYRLVESEQRRIDNIVEDGDKSDKEMFEALFKRQKAFLPGVSLGEYIEVVRQAISQIVYESALSMAESEFSGDTNPVPYDAEELNRIVTLFLSANASLVGSITTWQPAIIDILKSEDIKVIRWLNRLRKAYWLLAVLGIDPSCIGYKKDHFKKYCVYLDSHIVLRAMVLAGGECQMCQDIIKLGKELVHRKLSC